MSIASTCWVALMTPILVALLLCPALALANYALGRRWRNTKKTPNGFPVDAGGWCTLVASLASGVLTGLVGLWLAGRVFLLVSGRGF